MKHVTCNLPSPERLVRGRLPEVDSVEAAQALLDDYIDATVRSEHSQRLGQSLQETTTRALHTRLIAGGGLDEMLASARPAFEALVVQPVHAYIDLVPTAMQAGEVIHLGDDAAQAWREVQIVPQYVRQLIGEGLWPLLIWGNVFPTTTVLTVWEKLAAFFVPEDYPLRAAALAFERIAQGGVNDDPLGRLRTIGEVLQLNTLTEAIDIVQKAEQKAVSGMRPAMPDQHVAKVLRTPDADVRPGF